MLTSCVTTKRELKEDFQQAPAALDDKSQGEKIDQDERLRLKRPRGRDEDGQNKRG